MRRALVVFASFGLLAYAGEETPAVAPAPVEESGLRQLLSVRRVFIDRLTGG